MGICQPRQTATETTKKRSSELAEAFFFLLP
jgi:hypothetical protein